MKTHIHFLSYLAQFFLEWEIFQKKKSCRENHNTYILCSITFPEKITTLLDNVEKHGRARQATDGSIIRRMRLACWITKATDTHSE